MKYCSIMVHFGTPFFALLFMVSSAGWWIQGVLAMNVLVGAPHVNPVSMTFVMAKQYLNVSNFYLVMQPDCKLVTYNGSTPFLTSEFTQNPIGPSLKWICYATMQADGHFVVYQKVNSTFDYPIWASVTFAEGYQNSTYRYLILGRDGSLTMYEPNGSPMEMKPFIPVNTSVVGAPSPAPAMSQNATSNLAHPFPLELTWKPEMPLDGYPYMPAEYFLSQGSKLQTADGRFTLMLGHECNLQIQEIWTVNNTVKNVIWDPQARLSGQVREDCELRLQQDGRLEIRDNVSGVVYWNSSVTGDDSVNWVLKLNSDDGHVSVSDILNSTNILWSSIEPVRRSQSGTVAWPIVVGVIGGVLSMAMTTLTLWYFYVRPRFRDPAEKAFRRRLQSLGGKSQVLTEVSIKQATDNFKSRIGSGGFGDVFYGRLADGQEIAAKVLAAGSHQSKEEFYNEIELLSVVHHKYLVSLLGYSSTWKHQILIYEYMGGGDLRHRLQGDAAAKNPLSWRQRTSITLQVAEGLEYLHDKCSPAIIHRDVKSNNILLTNPLLVAKVADFGLSKLRTKGQEDATHITTVVKGTPGYLDPEYHETGMLTEKSDVYAFGIVMMEILTGQHQLNIAQGVSDARRLGQFDGLADPSLGGDFDRDEFVSLVELSLWCVRKSNLRRPCMREVVRKLREIGLTPLESMHPEGISGEHLDREHVMTFGTDFVHSEPDSRGIMSFSGFTTS